MSIKTFVHERFCAALRGRLTAVAAILATATFSLAFNSSTATAALVAYYPLNGNLNDASGNGNNGISGGAVVFAPGGGIVLNGSGHTQGTGPYFNAPVNINSFPQVTFGGWFEVAGTDPQNGMIVDDAGGFGRGLDIDNRSGNTGYSAFNGSGVFGGIAPSGPATFDFVAVTYNSGDQFGNARRQWNIRQFHGHSAGGRHIPDHWRELQFRQYLRRHDQECVHL
jgi:hypothetical protein